MSTEGTTGEFDRPYTDLDEYEYERDCEGVFSLDFLQDITTVKTLAKQGTFKFMTNLPIIIIPKIEGVVLKYALAPRVEDDEDDMFED